MSLTKILLPHTVFGITKGKGKNIKRKKYITRKLHAALRKENIKKIIDEN